MSSKMADRQELPLRPSTSPSTPHAPSAFVTPLQQAIQMKHELQTIRSFDLRQPTASKILSMPCVWTLCGCCRSNASLVEISPIRWMCELLNNARIALSAKAMKWIERNPWHWYSYTQFRGTFVLWRCPRDANVFVP